MDYAPEYLDPQLPVSFHKHWMIDPVRVYSKWFSEVDQQMEADYLAQKHVELWNIFNRKINKWFMYIAVLYCKIENKYLITEQVYFSLLLLLYNF